jgi:hypothetical protein
VALRIRPAQTRIPPTLQMSLAAKRSRLNLIVGLNRNKERNAMEKYHTSVWNHPIHGDPTPDEMEEYRQHCRDAQG